MTRRLLAALAAVLSVAAPAAVVTGSARADVPTSPHAATHAVCSSAATWQCRAEVVVGGQPTSASGPRAARVNRAGYTATDLQKLYRTRPAGHLGRTPTIAIVDAYDYRHAAADLAYYRRMMGLRPCGVANGCLRIVNQKLKSAPLPAAPPARDDWTLESALDLQAASAVCPRCHLVLVEAANSRGNGLLVGAHNARRIAHYVSMSWGGTDDGSIPKRYFSDPNTIYTAATGDDGYSARPDAPSTLTDVVGVGGVRVPWNGATVKAWSGAGSSCSRRIAAPGPQSRLDTGCAHKAGSDVSGIADPQYGIAVYDSDARAIFGALAARDKTLEFIKDSHYLPGSRPQAADLIDAWVRER